MYRVVLLEFRISSPPPWTHRTLPVIYGDNPKRAQPRPLHLSLVDFPILARIRRGSLYPLTGSDPNIPEHIAISSRLPMQSGFPYAVVGSGSNINGAKPEPYQRKCGPVVKKDPRFFLFFTIVPFGKGGRLC